MKKYKFLIPLILIALFAAAVYIRYDSNLSVSREYNRYLKAARDYRNQEIPVDAEANYKKALKVKPSLALYVEIGEFYTESGQIREAIKWGENILAEYPKEKAGYELLINLYAERENYVACFELAETLEKRNMSSDIVSGVIKSIEYEYFFNCNFAEAGIYSGGLCPVRIEDRWGYVNMKGESATSVKYLKAGYFSGELAPVVDSDNKAYYIDPNGNKKKVITSVGSVQELGLLSNGIFTLYDGQSWSFYSDDEEFLFGGYDEASSMGNGIAAVCKGGKWALIDRAGKPVGNKNGSSEYKGVVMDEKRVVYRNERIFVYDGSAYHMIDSSGKAFGEAYEDARLFKDETYAAVKLNGKWGFIDKKGAVIIEPRYEDARSFSNGLAAVKQDGKWGFIDAGGNMVIEAQFDDARDFTSEGSAFIREGRNWRLLRLYKYNHSL